MAHIVFESVIAIAVLVVFISNIVIFWLIYGKIKKLETMAPKLDSLLNEAQGFLNDARGTMALVAEAQPSIKAIGETVDKAQHIVSKTSDAIATTTETIQGRVIGRLHQISYVAVAVN